MTKAQLLRRIKYAEFFDARVERIPFSGCWIWLKSIQPRGYGTLMINTKMWLAHRLSYSAFVGAIPSGMLVCHRCDVAQCVNPEHLYIGTDRDNLNDAYSRHRRKSISPEQINLMQSLRTKGALVAQIRKSTGISRHVVYNHVFRKNTSE